MRAGGRRGGDNRADSTTAGELWELETDIAKKNGSEEHIAIERYRSGRRDGLWVQTGELHLRGSSVRIRMTLKPGEKLSGSGRNTCGSSDNDMVISGKIAFAGSYDKVRSHFREDREGSRADSDLRRQGASAMNAELPPVS